MRRLKTTHAAALAACLLAVELSGCISPGQCCEAIHHDKLACRGWRARKDCYGHEGKDFKLGFLDGYIGAMTGGADVCQPVVPPQRYWSTMGCRGTDCDVVNRYFNGWGHGVAAAAQDGMAGFAQVPIRPRPQVASPLTAAAIPPTPIAPATPYDLSAPYEPVAPLEAAGDLSEPADAVEETAPAPPEDKKDYFPGEKDKTVPDAPELDPPAKADLTLEVPEEAPAPPAAPKDVWKPRDEQPARVSLDLGG